MTTLSQIRIKGFKSIQSLEGLNLGPVNVLIGANGAGKSNLISFFQMLAWMIGGTGNLQLHIGKHGGGSSFLFDGSLVTTRMQADLTFETQAGINEYAFELIHAAKDSLIFAAGRSTALSDYH